MQQNDKILDIQNLDISFHTTAGAVHAIRGIDVELHKGQTVAIVGESGSGKSVTMKAAMGILASNATVSSGNITFRYHHQDGSDAEINILEKDKQWIRRHINGKRISMVFQDPMTSLDPTMTIGKQITEGMIWHYNVPKQEAWKKAEDLLREVGIEDAAKRMKNYPHQLSGGMRQRVVIAIALSCDPDFLICDEPTTALDVTIQAQILELMKDLQNKMGMAIILVTHDLGVIASMCDEIIVMYGGRVCERGTAEDIFYRASHEYTKGLLRSIPNISNMKERLIPIAGSPINLLNMPKGCAFCSRCDNALKICLEQVPDEIQMPDGHYASCWLNVKKQLEEDNANGEQ